MKIEVSNGEILDKLTILKIKLKNIKDEEKLKHVRTEHDFLENISMNIHYDTNLFEQLLIINNKLWDIEDAIRNKERAKEFDDEFITLARSVYFTNDKRAKIKKDLNIQTNSNFVEIKSYNNY